MIHTIELSKMISADMFNEIINSLNIPYNRQIWFTNRYMDKGILAIGLYKFKRKSDNIPQSNEIALDTHYYMIMLTISTSAMFGKDYHIAQEILCFTPDFVRAIYQKIFEIIPCLNLGKSFAVNSEAWMELNAFKVRRIDFAFDFKYMHQIYLQMINQGYGINRKTVHRNYYSANELQAEINDDDPNINIYEEMVDANTPYKASTNYVYYSCKSMNINIYHKMSEIENEHLTCNSETDYDFLRIEIQAKKNKLNYLIKKLGLKGRELQYIATPEVEHELLHTYVKALVGNGIYVSYDEAIQIINQSEYTNGMKQKLITLIDTIAKKHSVAKVIEEVKNGTITTLGSYQSLQKHLKLIEQLGINPVTISRRVEKYVPVQTFTNGTGTSSINLHMLPNLVDIIEAYHAQTLEYRANGIPVTEKDLEAIDKIQ